VWNWQAHLDRKVYRRLDFSQVTEIIGNISKSPDQHFFRELANTRIAAAKKGDGADVRRSA